MGVTVVRLRVENVTETTEDVCPIVSSSGTSERGVARVCGSVDVAGSTMR